MRRDVLGLGVVLAVGGLAYGSSRIASPSVHPSASVAIAEPSLARRADTPRRALHHPVRRDTAGSIAGHVRDASFRHGVPESLVAAVISVESEFNPRAVSHRGAVGLMQLMPTTAALLGVRDAFDPRQNVDAGARHLRDLLDRFSNNVSLALAAYNAGPQAVVRHGGIPPYPETRAFVTRVLGRVGRVAMPTGATAQGAAPPARFRVGRPIAEPLRRADDEDVAIQVSVPDDIVGRASVPLIAPAPPVPPAARSGATDVTKDASVRERSEAP